MGWMFVKLLKESGRLSNLPHPNTPKIGRFVRSQGNLATSPIYCTLQVHVVEVQHPKQDLAASPSSDTKTDPCGRDRSMWWRFIILSKDLAASPSFDIKTNPCSRDRSCGGGLSSYPRNLTACPGSAPKQVQPVQNLAPIQVHVMEGCRFTKST